MFDGDVTFYESILLKKYFEKRRVIPFSVHVEHRHEVRTARCADQMIFDRDALLVHFAKHFFRLRDLGQLLGFDHRHDDAAFGLACVAFA